MLPVAEKIRSLRQSRNITQTDLLDALGVSFQSVSRWERGQAYPDIELIPKIAAYFGVTTDALLVADDDAKAKELDDKNTKQMMEFLQSELSDNQVIIASIFSQKDFFVDFDKVVTFKNRAIEPRE